MPTWPTLYPLLMHYKKNPNFPFGTGDYSINRQDTHLITDLYSEGLKTRELYAKYKLLI